MSPWRWMALAVTAVPTLLLLGGTSPAWSQRDGGPQIEIKAHGYGTPQLTSTENVFRSPGIDTDETYSYTFTKPGTYEYFCTLHPMMTGKVEVRSGS